MWWCEGSKAKRKQKPPPLNCSAPFLLDWLVVFSEEQLLKQPSSSLGRGSRKSRGKVMNRKGIRQLSRVPLWARYLQKSRDKEEYWALGRSCTWNNNRVLEGSLQTFPFSGLVLQTPIVTPKHCWEPSKGRSRLPFGRQEYWDGEIPPSLQTDPPNVRKNKNQYFG